MTNKKYNYNKILDEGMAIMTEIFFEEENILTRDTHRDTIQSITQRS